MTRAQYPPICGVSLNVCRRTDSNKSRPAVSAVRRRRLGSRDAHRRYRSPHVTTVATHAGLSRRARRSQACSGSRGLSAGFHEGLLTMFLVSWSLFSRLSRMKDSVSSSCERWRGDHHHRPTPRPTLTSPSAPQSMPWHPSFTFYPASPSSVCPRFPAAGRKPPAGESSQRTARLPLPPDFAQSPARLPSLSHPLPPSVPPPDALVAPCWEWQAELENGLRAEAILSVAGIAALLGFRTFPRSLKVLCWLL